MKRRKKLLKLYRNWKLHKRNHWNIVVTDRAKKEMSTNHVIRTRIPSIR